MIWRCPKCLGPLAEAANEARCGSCNARYESIAGILDLRLPGATWIDREADRSAARRLLAVPADAGAEALVRQVFSSRPTWNEAQVAWRARQVMAAPDRLRRDIRGWLRPSVQQAGLFLDLGCGPGMLLAATTAEGRNGIGIDVSLEWLVVAQRLISEWGGRPILAAALAEALPLADGAIDGVISLDVIEHVGDPARFLHEINRVTKPGGSVALSTPNRYSLAAEPHVSVWGVGWLPRSLQKGYVKWRSGKDYEFVRLLSTTEIVRLFRQHTSFQCQLMVAPVPKEEMDLFPAYRAVLAGVYNWLCRFQLARWVFLKIGPFFRVVGTKAYAV